MANANRVAAANDDQPAAGYEWANVLLSAVVRNAFGDHSVTIREVCGKGAVLKAAVAPPAGSWVLLLRGDIAVMGTVTWAERGRYCLEFQDVIDHEQLLMPIPSVKKLDQPLKALFPLAGGVPGTVSKH